MVIGCNKAILVFRRGREPNILLECSKRAVEIAIEQDEQAAIDWLENETKEMQI